jgi:hypothetical protein
MNKYKKKRRRPLVLRNILFNRGIRIYTHQEIQESDLSLPPGGATAPFVDPPAAAAAAAAACC